MDYEPLGLHHQQTYRTLWSRCAQRSSDQSFRLAYIVRAVSPGAFTHPSASVEDMYRPSYRAQSGTGRITIAE